MKYILTIEAEFEENDYVSAMETALAAAQAIMTPQVKVRSVVHKAQPEIKQPYTLINDNTRPVTHNLLAVGNAE